MAQIVVGIAGATGYTGAELARLLLHHPHAKLSVATSNSSAGKKLAQELVSFSGATDLALRKTEAACFSDCNVVFSCLPHGASAELVAKIHAAAPKIKIIDLSADFRLEAAGYKQWYGHDHPAPELLDSAVYGLPELNRGAIAKATIVANPGCYPTGALLALAPLARTGLLQAPFIVDAKSGTSGAGKEPSRTTHFVEVNESLHPYNVGTHRHAPEIARHLGRFTGRRAGVTFTPHLVPINRGILTTAYATPAPGVAAEDLRQLYDKAYAGEPFVRRVEEVDVKNVRFSNAAHVNAWISDGIAVLTSAIDNLGKGASGQAVQNMNLLFGLPEDSGLSRIGVTP